jgi:hypothetical protein
MDEAEKWVKHQYRVYSLGRSPVEGDPSKKARAIAIHRLGLDTGG